METKSCLFQDEVAAGYCVLYTMGTHTNWCRLRFKAALPPVKNWTQLYFRVDIHPLFWTCQAVLISYFLAACFWQDNHERIESKYIMYKYTNNTRWRTNIKKDSWRKIIIVSRGRVHIKSAQLSCGLEIDDNFFNVHVSKSHFIRCNHVQMTVTLNRRDI